MGRTFVVVPRVWQRTFDTEQQQHDLYKSDTIIQFISGFYVAIASTYKMTDFYTECSIVREGLGCCFEEGRLQDLGWNEIRKGLWNDAVWEEPADAALRTVSVQESDCHFLDSAKLENHFTYRNV